VNSRRQLSGEKGTALIITLLALFLFTVFGLYMTLNATTGLCISDNFESQLQATYAALAGLNHARALLRGLAHDDLLKGPDGTHDQSTSFVNRARSFKFRNPLPLEKALSVSIDDPLNDVKGISDDGLINTGFCDGMLGKELIPITGIGIFVPDPYNPGTKLLSRYFVKITDNNGESSEIDGDLNDSPFSDGDGTVILRSLGVARTIPQTSGSATRFNSIAIFELRLKRLSTWDVGPAIVILGSTVNAAFSGVCDIAGGVFPGIGTIDTIPEDTAVPADTIRTSAEGFGIISGGGYVNPSVKEISGRLNSNTDQSLLLDPKYLWDFVHNQAPRAADTFFEGSQTWVEGNTPYLGSYDYSKPPNALGQDPKITVVKGNLHVTGGFSGGGLIVVTGDFSVSGPCAYNGLVLLVGAGKLAIDGSGEGIAGGLFVASLENYRGEIVFGTPSLSISGRSRFAAQRDAVKMAIGLLPASQVSFREITNSDP
jgi:hypothetical protein